MSLGLQMLAYFWQRLTAFSHWCNDCRARHAAHIRRSTQPTQSRRR